VQEQVPARNGDILFQGDAGLLIWLRLGLVSFFLLQTAGCLPLLYISIEQLEMEKRRVNRGQEGTAADRKAYEDETRELAGKLDPEEQQRVEKLYRESPGSLRAEEMVIICRSSNVAAGQGLRQHERFVACMEGNGFSWVGAEWVKCPPPRPP
jgi:hypothetical protein